MTAMQSLPLALIATLAFAACSSGSGTNTDAGSTDSGTATDGPTAGDSGADGDVANNDVAVTDVVASPWPTPQCFSGGTTPQIDLSGPVANWTWNDPHVVKTDTQYVMYASATDSFHFPVRSYRLTSTDGATWQLPDRTPILADAPAGSWDAGGIETPAVVFFRGQYHMFYTGYATVVGQPGQSPAEFRVGHAVSSDGVTFTRVGADPVVSPSGTTDSDASNDWYAFIVAEPGPVVVGDQLFLYFTAIGASVAVNNSLQVVGVVTSADGTTWSAPQLALSPDQSIYPRDQDWVGYSTPNAAVIDGAVHLFFDVARQPAGGNWRQIRLHHARSANGISQWTQDATPILSAGFADWAQEEVRSPAALLDGTTLRLYFAAHTLDSSGAPTHFGIGMLTCPR